ncbi:MAG: polysaccharide deacetylase family protein [Bacteroidetes bacterium]|nr:polysaccharide deacetylase family protein [Bacteroidota bacterium]MBS1684681.1 polysaccharide deacetylase family protein [Bacteroidota bacterium]
MSVRKSFISFTSPFTSVLPLSVLTALTGHHFIIPFYHVVSDEPCPHIRHLYSFKNVKQFERDLDHLTSQYKPIAASDLEDVVAGKYKGKKIMLLTFDDGLRQMYDTVTPILLRKGIPAVFFVNNDFVDNKALMFRYKVSLGIGADYDKYFALSNNMDKIKSDTDLQEILDESLKDDVLALNELCDSFLKSYKPYMTSAQIRALISQGFSIGSHSMNHPYYHTLSLEQQLSQTLDSIDGLQKQFNIRQRLFAFPFTDHGVSKAFFDKIFTEGKMDFTFGGAGIKNDIHPRQMQRIPMEGWAAGAEQTLKSEYLYYLLRAPLMRNTIKR